MARHVLCAWAILGLAWVNAAVGAVPSEKLLPAGTAGCISVPDVDALRERWNATQLGMMFDDPVMAPFKEDLNKQLKSKLSKTGVKLGVTWEDLDGVYGGEVALAAVQPLKADGTPDVTAHALVLIVDVTGKDEQVAALLKKIVDSQKAKGGKVTVKKFEGTDVTDIELAKEAKAIKEIDALGDHAYYAVLENQLVASDNLATVTGILSQIKKPNPAATLAETLPYKAAMKKVADLSGDTKPHARWFVNPFRYAEVARAMMPKRKRGTDIVKVLKKQGFDAVLGLAGHVTIGTEEHDILHRSYIYAPQDPRVEKHEKAEKGDKYLLGARMLDFPNKDTALPPKWVPANCGAFLSMNWKMKDAFGKYLGSIVDEFADDAIFDEVLESIKEDPTGPMVDLRAGLIDLLGERLMIITDTVEPIDVQSERLMLAVEVTDEKKVAETLEKAMKKDDGARLREHKGHAIWEIINEEDPDLAGVDEIKIDGPGIGGAEKEAPEDEEEVRKIPNLAITVAHGHLIVSSHVDFIIKALEPEEATLDMADDFRRVNVALDKLGAGKQAIRHFVRTDKAYHTTYELVRKGKMPEGKTILARVLNRLMADEDADEMVIRKQQIDGEKMPEYSEVRKYFGPAGFYMISEDEGWQVTGCLLKK